MTTNFTVRGSQARASTTLHSQADLLRALDADVNAASTLQTKASQFRTWRTFHLKWFGAGAPVLPLTPDAIRAVVA